MIGLLNQCKAAYSANANQTTHRRGQFTAVSLGISYGGGQKVTNVTLLLAAHTAAILTPFLIAAPRQPQAYPRQLGRSGFHAPAKTGPTNCSFWQQ